MGASASKTVQTADEVFLALKELFAPVAPYLQVTVDKPDNYTLESIEPTNRGRPMYFGAVKTGKAYVSFHLMPVYAIPSLVAGMSPELRKRMQGKSCFNFKRVEPELFRELKQITLTGFEKFRMLKFV